MAIFNSYVTNYQRVQNRGKTHQNLWDFSPQKEMTFIAATRLW
jgi:hypothetical protein